MRKHLGSIAALCVGACSVWSCGGGGEGGPNDSVDPPGLIGANGAAGHAVSGAGQAGGAPGHAVSGTTGQPVSGAGGQAVSGSAGQPASGAAGTNLGGGATPPGGGAPGNPLRGP